MELSSRELKITFLNDNLKIKVEVCEYFFSELVVFVSNQST